MTTSEKENNVTGLVASLIDWKEKDKLATLITPNGRLSVCFKGVRGQNAKLKAFAAPFVVAELFVRGNTVTGGTLLDSHKGLQADVLRAASAAVVCEAVGWCSADGSALQEEFPLTLVALKTIETLATFPPTPALWFLLHLMQIEGADSTEFPLPASVSTLFATLKECNATDIDSLEVGQGSILEGLSFASKIFQNSFQITLKSVLEVLKLVNFQNRMKE